MTWRGSKVSVGDELVAELAFHELSQVVKPYLVYIKGRRVFHSFSCLLCISLLGLVSLRRFKIW